jgi:hypothetical protein
MMQPDGIVMVTPYPDQNLSSLHKTPASNSFLILPSLSILMSSTFKLFPMPIERCLTSTVNKQKQAAAICTKSVFMAYLLIGSIIYSRGNHPGYQLFVDN